MCSSDCSSGAQATLGAFIAFTALAPSAAVEHGDAITLVKPPKTWAKMRIGGHSGHSITRPMSARFALELAQSLLRLNTATSVDAAKVCDGSGRVSTCSTK
jgi:hypothetical protein